MDKNCLVVKSNSIIEAGYTLSLVEQRIILMAVAESRRTGTGPGPDVTLAREITISAAEYAEMFKVPVDEAYKQLKTSAHSIFLRYVTLYDGDDKTEMHWLSHVKYRNKKGIIEIQFAQKMAPYISNLEKHFTRYTIGMIANMTSIHAIRLYEILKEYQTIGLREIEVSWLRKMLELENKYPLVKDLKRWVVDVAVKQINEYTDVHVVYKDKKSGRTITHLVFDIKTKETTKPEKAEKLKAAAQIPPPPFDKASAKKGDAAIFFLQHCCPRYMRDHAATHAPGIVLGTKVLWDLYRADFEAWLAD